MTRGSLGPAWRLRRLRFVAGRTRDSLVTARAASAPLGRNAVPESTSPPPRAGGSAAATAVTGGLGVVATATLTLLASAGMAALAVLGTSALSRGLTHDALPAGRDL